MNAETNKADAIRSARAPERERRRRERACFWTWPLGHVWRWSGSVRFGNWGTYYEVECASCGKRTWK